MLKQLKRSMEEEKELTKRRSDAAQLMEMEEQERKQKLLKRFGMTDDWRLDDPNHKIDSYGENKAFRDDLRLSDMVEKHRVTFYHSPW